MVNNMETLVLYNIDFELLLSQKENLLTIIRKVEDSLTDSEKSSLEGIVSLLDCATDFGYDMGYLNDGNV